MYSIKIALRSLLYRKTQYISLFLVCMFGVVISLGAISVSTGMINSMTEKAKSIMVEILPSWSHRVRD